MRLTFLITALIIVATPGVGVLFTVSAGLARGARAGVVAAFGCTLGIVPHLVAAVTGTAALLQASGVAFEVVKALGVAYLLYMAWASWHDKTPLIVSDDEAHKPPLRVIGSAVLANVLNPKLTIFFFAFLPQFATPDSPNRLLTMIALSLVFMAMTFIVFSLYGIFAAGARRHLIERPKIVQRIRRCFAASFVLLSAKLATTTR
jgi:threonine/homoserine/homoserine lactone efflux protein